MSGHWLDHVALVSLGLIVAAIAAIPARRLLRRDPTACYRLCLALLFGALALLPLQWIVQGAAHDWVAPARAGIVRWLEPSPPPRPRSRLPADDAILVNAPMRGGARERADAVAPASLSAAAAPTQFPVELRPAASTTLTDADAAGTARTPFDDRLARAGQWLLAAGRSAVGWLDGRGGLALWLLGVVLVFGRRAVGVARTVRLLRAARPVTDPELLATWRQVAGSSRVAGRVRLLASDRIASPACVGWFRPILLVPGGSQPALRKEVLAWALRHELVHLERGDSRIAALQALVTTLLWFHPAAWWLSAEIGRLRELSCDQLVVGGSGRRRSYALALLEYAAVRNGTFAVTDAGPHSAGVRCALLHWSRSPSQMQRRIEMLTVDSDSASSRRRRLGRLVALGAFLAPVLAQVGVAATLLPKDGGQDEVRAVAAPVSRPPAAPAGSGASLRIERVPSVSEPCAVAGSSPAASGDGCCAAGAAPKQDASAKTKRRITTNVEPRVTELVNLKAQLADDRATAERARAKNRARAQELRTKLEAATVADDEEACAALESALDRCDAECDEAEAACEAQEVECEELADALESLQIDLDVDLQDLMIELQDLPQLAEIEGLQDMVAELGDLGELGVIDLTDVQAELPAVQEEVRRALAGANDEIAAAMQQVAAAHHGLNADDKKALEEKIRCLIEQQHEHAAAAHAEDALHRAMGAAAGARHGQQVDEQARTELRAKVQAARKMSADAQAQHAKARRQQEVAERAQEQAQVHQELAERAHARARDQAKVHQELIERTRSAQARRPMATPPRAPSAPGVDELPEPPHPGDVPRVPGGGVRTRSRFAPAPAEADQRMLLERIAALEAEIAELRAALDASRSTPQPPADPPAPGGGQRRSRSMR